MLQPFEQYMAAFEATQQAHLEAGREELERLRQQVIQILHDAEATGQWARVTQCRELLAQIESPETRALFGYE